MARAVVFFVAEMFLLGIISGQTTPGQGCPIPCSECKDISEGEHSGYWYLKAEVDPLCPNRCLYGRTKNGKEAQICMCDPGQFEYDSCNTAMMLVVTGGDNSTERFNSSETISYDGVCSSPNIPQLPETTAGGKSVWINDSTLMFCGGSQTFLGGEVDSTGWSATDICWKLKPGDTDWKSEAISNMNVNRSWFSLNSINAEEAVAAGGLDNNGTIWDTLEKYSGGEWKVIDHIKLDKPTYGHCAVQYTRGGNSYLMIIGGSHTFGEYWNATASVTQIDLSTGDKVSVDPGPLPALWAPACTIDGEDIFVSGGGIQKDNGNQYPSVTSEVFRYNLNDGYFTYQGNLTIARWGASMGVTAKGQMVVAGGWTGTQYLENIDESSIDGGLTWNRMNPGLSQKREYAAMASVPALTFMC